MASSNVFGQLNVLKPYDPTVQQARDLVRAQREEQIATSQAKRSDLERQAKDEEAIRAVLASAPDQETAIKGVYKINPKLGGDLQKGLDDHREKVRKSVVDDLDADMKQMGYAGQLLQAANASSYPMVRATIAKMVGNDPEKASFLSVLPEQYDPAAIKTIIDMSTPAKEFSLKQRQAVEDMFGKDPARGFYDRLSLTESPEEWAAVVGLAKEAGVPAGVIQSAGAFSPESVAKMGQMALTANERATISDRQASATALQADRDADNARQDKAASATEAYRAQQLRLRERTESRLSQSKPTTGPDGTPATPKLGVGAQGDVVVGRDLVGLIDAVEKRGNQIGWKGVGAGYSGSINQALSQVGIGTQDEEQLRNELGNIQGTIAKLRGGTSFTPSEQKLLDTYTPTINDSDSRIQAKLKSLRDFLVRHEKNIYDVSGGGSAPASGGSDKSVTMAQIQAVAKRNGTTVEQEKARAAAEGYVVR
jgi:hypothetical protein